MKHSVLSGTSPGQVRFQWHNESSREQTCNLFPPLSDPRPLCRGVGARMHVCIHACKSDIPSESPVAPCLHKPVVFRAVITVDSHGIHWLPPGCGAIACSSLSAVCVLNRTLSLLRSSLVKIYSQRNGGTERREMRRERGALGMVGEGEEG